MAVTPLSVPGLTLLGKLKLIYMKSRKKVTTSVGVFLWLLWFWFFWIWGTLASSALQMLKIMLFIVITIISLLCCVLSKALNVFATTNDQTNDLSETRTLGEKNEEITHLKNVNRKQWLVNNTEAKQKCHNLWPHTCKDWQNCKDFMFSIQIFPIPFCLSKMIHSFLRSQRTNWVWWKLAGFI